MPLIAQNLSKHFKNQPVLSNVSLEVLEGAITACIGSNGAGKTTLFSILAGIIRPNRGEVFIDEKNCTKQTLYERSKLGICYLPQEHSIFRELTVKANLMAIFDIHKIEDSEKTARYNAIVGKIQLQPLENRKGKVLSGGEKRRVEIARAMLLNPKFLILDEPFAGLDPIITAEIGAILKTLAQEDGMGILLTDHNAHAVLKTSCYLYLLDRGKILLNGPTKSLLAHEILRKNYLGEDFL